MRPPVYELSLVCRRCEAKPILRTCAFRCDKKARKDNAGLLVVFDHDIGTHAKQHNRVLDGYEMQLACVKCDKGKPIYMVPYLTKPQNLKLMGSLMEVVRSHAYLHTGRGIQRNLLV